MTHHCYVVMGISSCGKSSVGQELARALGSVEYIEGDAHHPSDNVEKMRHGIPLNDDDRTPWLMSLHHLIHEAFSSSSTCVLACSALKKKYRDTLEGDVQGFVRYIWLDIDPALAKERCMLRGTESHFFPPSLIDSQYSILDMTTAESFCHVRIDRGVKVEDIVTQILNTIMDC